MQLKDTTEMMNSTDYKERFKAEYYQLKIRYGKLAAMICKLENNTLEFTPTCPYRVLKDQFYAMEMYMRSLVLRAGFEGIELEG